MSFVARQAYWRVGKFGHRYRMLVRTNTKQRLTLRRQIA